ncbi:ABC transporter substrate-binding protein [Bradyrhizobium sp. BR 10289]|uniref:ABC transporter substrate-binding protein n=1 Tax=Bradyrhizobium sp. BR 10289 TaxID=2749993 RepID=UPI001C64F229|nr:ABC transporter substrate-binding protein [Bradyrhizobium sp. BR 10289]MBW7970242.1 ABC transporter substrate-binding protein [Bradyrhizobium sp. BR 10289]
MTVGKTLPAISLLVASTLLGNGTALAEKKYGPGASDVEIKVGNIIPYSGPMSSFAIMGKTEEAYFAKINAAGGINGRRIKFISYDDGYSPPKSVEQARKLAEGDEVLLLFGALGTPGNVAIQKYLNQRKVPHLFVASGGTRFGDSKAFPWTMGWQPNYQSEGRIYAKSILANQPTGKVAVLWQNDDSGRDWLKGFRDGLGEKVDMIVADRSYEAGDPTIDSQVVSLFNSKADVLVALSGPKASAQAIRKVAELAWKPTFYLVNTSSSIANVLKPAGLENSRNIISTDFLKDPADPAWKDDGGAKAYNAFVAEYLPGTDGTDRNVVYAYSLAQTVVKVLEQCGDDLTRENVMAQAAKLKEFAPDMLLPGIKINTAPDDYFPIQQMQLKTFDGSTWVRTGEVLTGEVGHQR